MTRPDQTVIVATQKNASSSTRFPNSRGANRISTGLFRNLPTLWPDRMMMKMRYLDTTNTSINITPAAGLASVVYRTNSLYDPLTSTSAEQPVAGFTEMATLYAYYRVHSCKITVNAISTSGTYPTLAVVSHSNNNVVPSSYYTALESIGNPYTVWANVTTAYGGSVDLDNYVKLDKLVGQRVVNTDDDYASLCTTNPAKSTYGIVTFGSYVLPAATYNIVPVIQLEFWAEFYGRDFEYT